MSDAIRHSSAFDLQFRTPGAGDRLAGELPTPPPDNDGPFWRRTLAAVVDEQLVGVGTLALAPATETYFCEVTVTPAYRRRGIGTRLFAALHHVGDRPLPILGRAMSSRPVRRHFAEHLGGSVLIHCPMPQVDPTSAAGRHWTASQALPAGYETTAMADVPVEEVRSAWSSYFTWAHQPFGAVRADALPIVWDDYSRGVDAKLSQLCSDTTSGQIVALSLVSPDVWDGRTFVVAETAHRDQPQGVSLLQATVAASLRALANQGFQRVELEGHSTDAHAPQLFQSLPPGTSDPLDIYLLPTPE